jgi:NTP pyrophosphatase (non-canonical NTP hydrolase)
MEIIKAQEKVDNYVENFGGYWKELSMLARLVEEVGEFSRSVNIKFGDKKSKHEDDGGELSDELADVFFTVLALANKLEIDLDEALTKKIGKYAQRDEGIYGK